MIDRGTGSPEPNYAATVATRAGFEAFIRNEIVLEKPHMPVAKAEATIARISEQVGDSRAARRRFLTTYAGMMAEGRIARLIEKAACENEAA